MQVFVLDKRKKPLMPCHPARARELLKRGQAVVHKIAPFTIRLKDRVGGEVQPVRIKLDPGSKTTGIALVREEVTETETTAHVLFLAELTHRGGKIRDRLTARRALRRRRRGHLRYRKPRFDNRTRPEGWLAPSLQHRVNTTMSWVKRLMGLSPVSGISQELVRFDLQKVENPEISGFEYQQGTLAGYEVREYLLEKWNRVCAYCGDKDVPLEIDHIHPRSRGGTDRVSNLTLACHVCNQKKGNKDVSEFLKKKPDTLKRILSQAKSPLKDASAVNATRWALFQALKGTGLPVETASGGRTKWNRSRQGYPKTHWIDAACVGESGDCVALDPGMTPLQIKAAGHGNRQMCGTDAFGFPIRHRSRMKTHFGFQTGDLVRVVVPTGKYVGTHTGRVLCRASGRFDVKAGIGRFSVSHRHCTILSRNDGYEYGH